MPNEDNNSRFKISLFPPRLEAAGKAVDAVTKPSVLIPVIFGMVIITGASSYWISSRAPAAFSYIGEIIASILGRAFS